MKALVANRPHALSLALFYAAYVAAGGFGQGLAIIPGVSITFWPPAGIFVGTLLSFPIATWPWWVLAACLAELTCNAAWFHNAIPFALIYFTGNALAALAAASLTNRWLGRPFRMESLEEVALFVILGGGIAPLFSATVIAATDALIGKHAFLTAWPLVWLGDGSGLLISTPLTVVAIGAWRGRADTPWPRMAEGAALAALIVGVTALAFAGHLPTVYVTLPLLLWASLRFQLRGAAAALGLLTVATAWFTISGTGEFAGVPAEMQHRIIQLKSFLAISAISALLVAALARQHREALDALRASNAELERRVVERTAALGASEALLASTFAGIDVAITVSDVIDGGREFRFASVNPACVAWTGIARDRWLGSRPEDILSPEDAATVVARYREVVRLNRPTEYEERLVFPSGAIWALTSVSPLADAAGNPTRVVTTSIDITERKTAEEALAASERRMAEVLGVLPIGVGLANERREVVVANEVFRRYVPSAVPSADEARFALWEGRDAEGRLIERRNFPAARALRGERVWPGQEFLYHGDEERGPIWLRVAALPFLDDEGKNIGATIVIDDIDTEKRAADALRDSEERLRMAQEAAELGSWDHDIGSGRAEWSDETRRLLDVGPDEPASTALLLSRVHPKDRPRVEAAMAESAAPGGSGRYRTEYRIVLPDGTVRWLEAQGRVDRSGPDDPGRAHGVVRDVSERVNHEQRAELLMREVNHRSKNMLSLVQAIARQTVAEEPKDFVRRFEQRVLALAASQDLLIGSGWKGVEMGDLVRAQLAHFQDLLGQRIKADGPRLTLNAAAAQALGLALHELSTNAGKYGALSNGRGMVAIAWTLSGGDPATRRFAISWRESGGPPVAAPGRKGFGTAVIARMSRLSLDAEVDFDLAPDGLVWRLECLASRVLENGGSGAAHLSDMRSGGSTSGGIGHS